ncbi:MAG TPA: heavy metal-associated domain-containing protein [Acidimicrobiales bacterium]|nr:heavy metal-associated domain-containing protein [Acidimicrobiales bacterium]
MATATYEVTGMTCEHCVNAVKGELSQLPGVEQVDVQLEGGKVTVTSGAPVDAGEIRSAVEKAGYEVSD